MVRGKELKQLQECNLKQKKAGKYYWKVNAIYFKTKLLTCVGIFGDLERECSLNTY